MRSGERPRLWDVMELAPVERVADATQQSIPDPRILELIQARHGQAMLGFAMRLSRDPDRAADAVQETLFRLWREQCRGTDLGDPVAWSFRALYRICMDQHRFARRLDGLLGRLRGQAIVQGPGDDDGVREVWTEVDRLPDRQRHVLYLRYRADLSYDSIGTVLGITPGAARTMASRGLDRLRSRLGVDLG